MKFCDILVFKLQVEFVFQAIQMQLSKVYL